MLEQGPYVIKYSIREGKQLLGTTKSLDVKIYVNEKLVHDIKGEGVSSGKLKVVGNNYNDFNKLADGIGRGRRNIDYIKFIPKCEKMKKKEGFMNFREGVSNMEDPVAVAKQKNAILTYFKKVKDIMVNQGGEKGNGMKFLAVTNCSTCVLPQWGGYKHVMPLDWYRMHIDIIGGMKPTELADKYAPKFTADALKDKYYSGENNDKLAKIPEGRSRLEGFKKNK